MRKALFSALGAVALAVIIVSSASLATKAQSDQLISALTNFTWVFVIDHYRAQPETKEKADNLDTQKHLIPKQDMQRVIRRGHMSALAHICNLEKAHLANKVKLMKIERSRNKWSQEQLVFIHFLHFAAYALRMDYIEVIFDNKDGDNRTAEEKANELKALAKTKKPQDCSEEMRQRVLRNIEDYVRSDGKT